MRAHHFGYLDFLSTIFLIFLNRPISTSFVYISPQNGKKVKAIAGVKSLFQFSKDFEGFFKRNFDMLQWIYVRSLCKNLERIRQIFSLLNSQNKFFQARVLCFLCLWKELIFSLCVLLKREKSKHWNLSILVFTDENYSTWWNSNLELKN